MSNKVIKEFVLRGVYTVTKFAHKNIRNYQYIDMHTLAVIKFTKFEHIGIVTY